MLNFWPLWAVICVLTSVTAYDIGLQHGSEIARHYTEKYGE